tara:strand:+ start:86790 stop:90266 length:3477 start_codon:yes stop_codon:yes gene_type:complete
MPKVVSSGGLVDILSWDVKYPSSESTCNGRIHNLFINGGSPPYTLVWTGASSYSARTYNVENLCVGTYSATATDTNGDYCIIGLTLSATPQISLSASVVDNSCLKDFTKFCKIGVTAFEHNQPEFTYVLYKDGKVEDYFRGERGEESHTFTDLETGDYYITAFDGVVMGESGTADLTSYCTGATYCSGSCVTSNITGATRFQPESVFINYDRFNLFANYTLSFGGMGPGSSRYLNDPTTSMHSGISSTGITTNDPTLWLYTGDNKSRITENSTDWYLGTTAMTMNQGKPVNDTIWSTTGTTTITPNPFNVGRFMYNTTIDKFLMIWYTDKLSDYEWVTVEPTSNQGNYGNPSAAYWLTTSLNWNTSGLTPHQMTISGDNNTVVSATTKMTDANYPTTMLADYTNAGIVSGVISDCAYKTYTHEVTLGADGIDNDDIGIVLVQFRDGGGQYGSSGQTYNMSLNFNTSTVATTKIMYNYGNSAFAFISGNTSGAPYTGVSTTNVVLKNSQSPFSVGNYEDQGSIRVKITRSGEFGELFSIRMTDTMGNKSAMDTAATKDLGASNPYNSKYNIDFSLLDSTTWSGSTTSAPTYATGNELIKFIGPQKYGYLTASQIHAQFYDMYFSGETITTESDFAGTGFTLSSASTLNVIQSTGCDFVGWDCNQGVPQINPLLNISIQTLPGPAMNITGATPINGHNLNNYYIYSGENTSINFGYIWSANTQDMVNKYALPKINVFPYDFHSKKFLGNSLYERIFDDFTILPQEKRSNGQGLQTIDNIRLQTLEIDKYWEFIIKPSALYKDKVDSRLENWFDTLYLGDSLNYELGIYNNTTDRYFIITQQPTIEYRASTSFRFTGNTGLELKHYTTAVTNTFISSVSGYSSGATLVDLPVSFQGAVQTIVNGVTLLEAKNPEFTDGDYVTVDNRFVKIKPNTLRVGDKLDFYYVPGGGGHKSYLSKEITIPTTVTTSSADTIYQNGFFYFINLDFEPIGDVKVIINGLINSTTSLVAKKTLRIDYPNYPTLTPTDSLVLCYLSVLDVTGESMVKEPTVGYSFTHDPRFEEKVTLSVFDSVGIPVYTTSKKFNKNKNYISALGATLKTNTFGSFYYNLLVERVYMLINGDEIKRNYRTPDVNFHLSSSVYYGKPLTVLTNLGTLPGGEYQ